MRGTVVGGPPWESFGGDVVGVVAGGAATGTVVGGVPPAEVPGGSIVPTSWVSGVTTTSGAVTGGVGAGVVGPGVGVAPGFEGAG